MPAGLLVARFARDDPTKSSGFAGEAGLLGACSHLSDTLQATAASRANRAWHNQHMRGCALIGLVTLSVLIGGCADSATSPSSAPFSQTDLRAGAGAEAVSGATVTVNYTGWLYDASRPDQKGLQFDSSAGTTPFSFTLGSGRVIAGWDRGVAGMKVGGVRRLVVPPSLGYGGTRNGLIPPNATLVFDIELLSVQ